MAENTVGEEDGGGSGAGGVRRWRKMVGVVEWEEDDDGINL